jgi:hypothetical protein
VGPGAVLDAVVKRKIPSSRRESYHRTPMIIIIIIIIIIIMNGIDMTQTNTVTPIHGRPVHLSGWTPYEKQCEILSFKAEIWL